MENTSFLQVLKPTSVVKNAANGMPLQCFDFTNCTPLDKPNKWRANGKCKTWKRSPERFSLPIKFGLYGYGHITEENCHLFEVAK
jgi:hypothetical protein